MLEWLTGFFAAIDHLLPPKYFLFASSHSGYQISLFANAFPDRVEKLYLGSPAGFYGVEDGYDPYKVRTNDKVNEPPPREVVDYSI